MIKELKDERKMLKLQEVLDEFLDNDDCGINCDNCKHSRICKYIYRLNAILYRYSGDKRINDKEDI